MIFPTEGRGEESGKLEVKGGDFVKERMNCFHSHNENPSKMSYVLTAIREPYGVSCRIVPESFFGTK